ncbi:uncharacterized protein LOC141902004 [Tubulanus polymorphus]|uniref:uncharacterized protein LOC141902004 n=1 Tax=Tubulanus polymorphus TaxID=672921 RepID=UPI003DA1F25F
MDRPFTDYVEEAKTWQTEKTHFHLKSSVANENRLYFESTTSSGSTQPAAADAGAVTFFIDCPDGSTSWNIWSDQDRTLDVLKMEMSDFLQSSRPKTLTDILNKADKELKTLLGATCIDCKNREDESEDEEEDYDEDDDDFDSYYNSGDLDEQDDSLNDLDKDIEESAADQQFIGQGSSTAVHRLLKDYKALQKSDGKFGIEGSPQGNNLYIWDVKLTDFPLDSQLGKDLVEYAKRHKREPVVYIEMKFPKEYPMSPPFVRVIRPRFKFLTGHVTIGGSICMQMLTRSGWSPGNDIESILVQIRSEIISDGKARLDYSVDRPYDEAEAKQAFERMLQRYDWK